MAFFSPALFLNDDHADVDFQLEAVFGSHLQGVEAVQDSGGLRLGGLDSLHLRPDPSLRRPVDGDGGRGHLIDREGDGIQVVFPRRDRLSPDTSGELVGNQDLFDVLMDGTGELAFTGGIFGPLGRPLQPVSYTHLTLPTNREV